MSGIPYATGTIVSTTFVSATVSNIVNNLKDQLVIAGWTVVASAADDFTLESAITPQGLRCRVRLYAGTSSAKVSFRDQSEVRIGLDHFLVAGVGSFQVIACKYQFFVLLPGDSTTARTFVAGGVPYVEQSFIWECIWSQGNGISDGDTGTVRSTFRTIPFTRSNGGGSAHTWVAFNGFARNGDTTALAGSSRGDQQLLVPMAQGFAAPGYVTTIVWYDEAGVGADPASVPARISWCAANPSAYGSVKGTLWGTLVTTGKPTIIDETAISVLDTKDWQAITDPAGDPTHDSRGNGNVWTVIGN
jgi:hypothetical protein